MLFKDLKAGYSVYVFDRSKVAFSQAKVLSVSPPHFDNHYGDPMEMVVDVTLEGFQIPYTFKQNTDTGYFDNLVLSLDVNTALKEVAALRVQSEQALAQKDTYEANIEKCSQILAEFSPEFKAKRDNEKRFTQLEASVGELKDIIKGLVKELKS